MWWCFHTEKSSIRIKLCTVDMYPFISLRATHVLLYLFLMLLSLKLEVFKDIGQSVHFCLISYVCIVWYICVHVHLSLFAHACGSQRMRLSILIVLMLHTESGSLAESVAQRFIKCS